MGHRSAGLVGLIALGMAGCGGEAAALHQGTAVTPDCPDCHPGNWLAFTVEPSDFVAGRTMRPVQVQLLDCRGTPIEDASLSITISLQPHDPYGEAGGDAQLGGTLSATAVNGKATFSDLSMTQDVTGGHNLRAASETLAPATSNTFHVLPPPGTFACSRGYTSYCTIGEEHCEVFIDTGSPRGWAVSCGEGAKPAGCEGSCARCEVSSTGNWTRIGGTC